MNFNSGRKIRERNAHQIRFQIVSIFNRYKISKQHHLIRLASYFNREHSILRNIRHRNENPATCLNMQHALALHPSTAYCRMKPSSTVPHNPPARTRTTRTLRTTFIYIYTTLALTEKHRGRGDGRRAESANKRKSKQKQSKEKRQRMHAQENALHARPDQAKTDTHNNRK